MGSKKYPNEKEYSEFVSLHSGSTNASTDTTNTEYYFSINKEHLKKALDMIA